MPNAIYSSVTLLVTHYNRSNSLERLLAKFSQLCVSFGDIVVSDDSSQISHLNYIRDLQKIYKFRLITTATNSGLGNNINKGQDSITTPYTLYVQEDFIPTQSFVSYFETALFMVEENLAIDLVRFYAYFSYPNLAYYNNHFSEIIYKPWSANTSKIYSYSDHPHLRRSSFFEKFGRYKEGIKSDKTEYFMCLSFIQNKGKALFLTEFDTMFIQENSIEEPSTVIRIKWRQSDALIIRIGRSVFRQIKYNYDIHFGKRIKIL